ncbi:MAG: NAD-dependent epimerase/dehydratase family protein [Nitriliruptoraceae bacterium]
MRVLVTGARGKVGSAAATSLMQAGHDVVTTDLGAPVHERDLPGEPPYLQADLTDAGAVHALVRDVEAVVHTAAIPDPVHHAPHVVFANNVLAGFNVVEACVRWGVQRLVNLSSETVPGIIFAERPFLPPYLPIDELTPCHPQDPYGFGKHVIEQWCDAAVRRSDLSVVTIRPSWVQHAGNYERNLGPMVRDPLRFSPSFWSYTDNQDLAEAIRLSTEIALEGHELVYIAQPDNATGRPLIELIEATIGNDQLELRATEREDASGIDSSKARRLLGWEPARSWRDVLDDQGRAR